MPQLTASWLDTPIGQILAIADDHALHMLKFKDHKNLRSSIEQLQDKTHSQIMCGSNPIIERVKNELRLYFEGKLKQFTIPLTINGTAFQQRTWLALQQIPYGTAISYADLAKNIQMPTAHRAVANANGANNLSIIIPCHRVINTNGCLGGYAGGIAIKQWLLEHEDQNL